MGHLRGKTMKKRFFAWLCCGLILFLSGSYIFYPKKALSFSTALYSIQGEQVLLPDWQQIAFSQFPPLTKSGSFLANGIKRVWQQGQTPDQYLNLIDIQELSPELASLEYIFNNTGFNLANFSLDQFPLVGEQTIGQLVKIVPNLGMTNVLSVLPIASLLGSTCSSSLSGTINQALSSCGGQLANMLLNSINLSSFPLDSIPSLDLVPIGSFNNWNGQLISQIPGLSSLPLSLFPNPISPRGNLVARIDAVWGSAEAQRLRSVSGGYRVGFSIPCQGGNCAYIELDDLEREGRDSRGGFEGKSWIWGKQKVRGGSGCLGGKEPTGRHPWGGIFKVVVEDIDETTDMVETALYFRSCTICGCTPYVIGPVPFISYPVNSLIFLGDASPSKIENSLVKNIVNDGENVALQFQSQNIE